MEQILPILPESVVLPLCKPFSKAADSLLDLYGMTQNPSSPSQCVQCFFKLLHVSDSQSQIALQPLRSWIESNIEISIQAGDAPSGSFPVSLDQGDLEEFCHRAMERVRMDTMSHNRPIELTFRYKPSAA
ncbi:hypothetical protein [Cerasicoccus fimbriatus]|uniref:hypothetical protein n=1 Tax=Cerasicoccus fimbriatus TaxID=3014554 RepID=UPI0022B5D8A6|nr:hypothetical protein [Cerasicoccus sp. TK19100]